jgi:hypothetical protein
MGKKNKSGGTVITGSTVSGSAFATGSGSKASVVNHDSALEDARAVARRLAQQAEGISSGSPEVADPSRKDIAEVNDALADPPDHDRALSAMARITAGLSGVSALAGSVAALREALGRLVG